MICLLVSYLIILCKKRLVCMIADMQCNLFNQERLSQPFWQGSLRIYSIILLNRKITGMPLINDKSPNIRLQHSSVYIGVMLHVSVDRNLVLLVLDPHRGRSGHASSFICWLPLHWPNSRYRGFALFTARRLLLSVRLTLSTLQSIALKSMGRCSPIARRIVSSGI
jgi:hypothetical protein